MPGKDHVHAPQQVDQLISFLVGQRGKGLLSNLGRKITDTSNDRASLIGQHQPARAAVGGIRPPLYPALGLHSVDLPNQRHRLYLKEFRQTGLIDALIAGEIADDPALRSIEAKKRHRLLIKASGE